MNLRRKRMMLMDGQWYGYLRTATGNPLTLQNAKRLRKLTIYGNAVQDGTPSPDAPVEVQLCGDRTGNLFDITQISGNLLEVTDNKVYLSDYACSIGISPKRFLEMTGLNPGDTITCSNSAEVISGTANAVLGRVAFSAKNGGTPLILCSNNTKTITIPSDFNNDNYNNLLLYGAHIPDESGEQLAVMSDFAIYKGSYTADTLPAYEPYGYKVSGRAEGLNLLDVSDSANILNGDTVVDGDSITFTTTDYCYGIRFARLTLDPNTEYTLSYQSVNFDGNYTDSYGLRAVIDNSGVPGGASSYITFTTNETGDVTLSYYVGIPYEGEAGKILTIKGVALYKGSYTAETMPPYEPYQPPQDFAVYLPEQIAKVGDVADEVVVDMESKTAELRKNILQYEHSNDWLLGSNGKNDVTQRFYQISIRHLALNSRVISNVFAELNPSSVNIFNNDTEGFNCSNNSYLQVRVNKSRLDTVDVSGFKSWLAAYEETTPLIIYGEALTPVTTDITSLQQWDAMPQVSGTVTLTLSAEVDPSGAEAVYYSKERGE